MSDKNKNKKDSKTKVVDIPKEEVKKKRYPSDVFREVFSSTRNKKQVNVVDALYSIADSLKELNSTLVELYTTPDTLAPVVDEAPEDEV
jgi:hypothetical protein